MSTNIINKDINELEDNFKLKVIDFMKEVWEEIFITETYRSQKRQDSLYASGRTRSWPVLTYTRKSNHTWRKAIDIAFYWRELYPKDHSRWVEIWQIANKYWIDWWFDLWWWDKGHFQDDWTIYKKELVRFWPLITVKDFTFPSTVYNIPVRLSPLKNTTTIWLASVMGLSPKFKRNEIIIYEGSFKKYPTLELIQKLLMHEFAHFVYHKGIENKDLWIRISRSIDDYISNYAKTHEAEDFAEMIWRVFYKETHWPLPKKKLWNSKIEDKYYFTNILYNFWFKKIEKFLQDLA